MPDDVSCFKGMVRPLLRVDRYAPVRAGFPDHLRIRPRIRRPVVSMKPPLRNTQHSGSGVLNSYHYL